MCKHNRTIISLSNGIKKEKQSLNSIRKTVNRMRSSMLCILTAMMLIGATSQVWAVNFNPASSFLLPDTSPTDALVTDINADGNLDIIISMSGARGGDASIRMLMGNGTGSFTNNGQLSTGFGPHATSAGDFDSDGFVDLAITAPNDAAIHIFRGTGNNVFVSHQIITISTARPGSIGVADFNHDGILDLAIGDQSGTPFGLYVALGNGDATFMTPTGLSGSTNHSAPDLVIADLNGDLNLDIAFPSNIYLGAGDGSFSQGQSLATGQNIAYGDLDSDGDQDLIIASKTIVFTYLNDSNANFTIQPIKNLSTADVKDIAISDMDRDGNNDLILVDLNQENVDIFPGLGNGSYAASFSFAVGTNPTPLAIGDWNKDNNLDFATANDDPASSDASVLLQIPPNPTPGNIAPVANQLRLSTLEEAALAIQLTGTDNDQDALSYAIVQQPTNGILIGTAPNFTYQPNLGFTGTDSFTFKANDGSVDSNVASVVITVNPINDAPVANGQSVVTTEDTTLAITLTASDLDADPLTYNITTTPSNGALSGTPPNVTYHPNANYHGSDSFSFTANDGLVDSSPATILISVNSVNDVPIAFNRLVATNEDQAVFFVINGNDVDGDTLTYNIVTGPNQGVITGTAPSLTYTPNPDFNGSDSLTFVVNDGLADSLVATVTFTVNPVNDAPDAFSQAITGNEDTNIPVTLTATDIDSVNLNYTIVATPSNGILSGVAPNLNYQPNADFNGLDSFTFMANDGLSNSTVATVTITVDAINDAPVADTQVTSGSEDTVIPITLTATDVEGNALTYAVVTAPGNGVLSGVAPNLSYQPNANFNGSDSFTFKANDGLLDSIAVTVSITVNPVNDAPVASNQAVSGDEDTSIPVILSASDIDSVNLNYTVVTAPTNGILTGVAPNLSYQPNANYNGVDSFTFIANDGSLNSTAATVTVTVNSVNDAPIADNQAISGDEDSLIPLTLSATDIEGDALNYAVVNAPVNGVLSGVAPNLSYQPDGDFNGNDSFTFTANDGLSDSSIATINITVNPVADVPVAFNQSVSVNEDSSIAIALTATDADGDALTYTVIAGSGPVNGTLSGSAPNLSYQPNAGFNGSDSFSFKANDGGLDSLPATITITVDSVNDVPVANAQVVSTNEDTALAIVLTGIDVDGDALSFSVALAPAHGVLTGVAPNLSYQPNADYNGADSFTFIVNDGLLNSTEATVSITVNQINDAPVANGGPDQTVLTGIIVTLNGSASTDVDGDSLINYWFLVSKPAGSQAKIVQWTSVMTNFEVDIPGTYIVNYYVGDATLLSQPYVLTINTENSAPVANAGLDQTIQLGDLVALSGAGSSDVDGDSLSYSWILVSKPVTSTAILTGASTITPQFTADQPGVYTLELIVNDGTVNSVADTVIISTENIAPVADAGVDQSVFVDDIVTVDGGGSSDLDGDPLSYTWALTTVPAGSLAAIDFPSTVIPTFIPDLPGIYVAQLIVNDGVLNSLPNTVVINVDTPNTTPIANAGVDQSVLVNDIVTVDGSASSDIDGDALTFAWSLSTVPAGSLAALDFPTTVMPTFVPDLPGTYVAQLIVNDGMVNSLPNTVIINVETSNSMPVANAGVDQSVFLADLVTLDGSASSDADGDALTFSWSLTAVPVGSTAVIDISTAIMPTFTADLAGVYVAQLIVNDGTVDSLANTVTINVDTPNTIPTANAGLDQNVVVNDLVLLNGGDSSDADGDPITYNWSLTSVPAGSTASLSSLIIVNPDFTADVEGTYVAQLIVNDGLVNSLPDSVSITVGAGNTVPVANAGVDQNVLVGDLVTLDGNSSSDADSDPLSFSWSLTTPVGSGAVLTGGTTANPTFTADIDGSYLAQLIVNDGMANSLADTVTITVSGSNPTLPLTFSKSRWDAGDQKLLLKGSGTQGAQLYEVRYTSTGGLLGTFTGKGGGDFEVEMEVSSSAPCSVRIVEVASSAFIDQVITNAPANCL